MNETSPRSAARAPRQTRRPHPWVIGVLATLGAVIAVNGAMLWISLQAAPQLVTDDYYEQGLRYGREIDARQDSRATGWTLDTRPAPAGPATVGFVVRDGAGRPVTGLEGTVSAYRPAARSLDQTLPLREHPRRPGHYRAAFRRPAAGLWELTVSLSRNGDRLYETRRYVAP